ncbi:type II toxin-antitoxin system RelE/ParE family toxin [Mucilaginibacter rubeus]|uniref:Type II toxin-antitoxin system RelE/ParE family toxin n=1 Tax=Mucilaginibacter rubeus TaxID=2027860 RepID=A0A5C1I5Y8_9SPHI|nr:type II toxin-antitoxin system RelE/ParE family toxin [Mucilaginibacter rubeus]QEM13349.1 type II toxin-antitoxin system RelE/ParE family toxin [Mucilaginibacter rubeus]
MLREIKWSTRAIQEWVEILEYWIERNKSNIYSLKLDHLFKASFAIIATSPEIGRPTDFPHVRIKIIRDYIVYYRITPENIEILTVRDSRRDPKKFNL